MALESIKKEIGKEIEATKCFVELAIAAQKCGYTKAAKFFISEAQEDCEHAFLYARELDKYSGILDDDRNIVEITKAFYELEYGAIERISDMYKEAHKEDLRSIHPFLSKMMGKHTEDCYRAKKLLQKIEVLFSADSLSDIETLFEDEQDEDDNNLIDN